MKNTEVYSEETAKIMKGLAIAYERMLEFKRYKKSKVVVMQGDKIVFLEP